MPSSGTAPAGGTTGERPLVVRAALGAFVAELVLSVIALAVELTDFDAFVAQAVRAAGPDVSAETVRSLGWVMAAGVLLLLGVQALVVWFAWRRRNWARIVLCVLGALALAGLVSVPGSSGGQTGFVTSMSVFGLLLDSVGLVLLLQRPAREWFRSRPSGG